MNPHLPALGQFRSLSIFCAQDALRSALTALAFSFFVWVAILLVCACVLLAVANSSGLGGGISTIRLRVRGPDGTMMLFQQRRRNPFLRLMLAFCARMDNLDETLRFSFRGVPLDPNSDTPNKCGMQNMDVIGESSCAPRTKSWDCQALKLMCFDCF